MFQTPAYTLMNLDSSVVQMDFFSPLLLVSTLARCYVCDTVLEQYKQIGNKSRNGEFGACFYKIHKHESDILDARREERNINDTRGAFNLISDGDSNILGKNHSKIFCARPGSRLWEVSADGIVVKTHQFKEALAIPPIAIFRSGSTTLESSQGEGTEREWSPQSVNFSHLHVISHKYLFSYTTNGLYIIDPASASVLLWSNEYTNISMTAVVDDRIYLMTCDNEFHCLELSSLDSLIVRLYRHERYSGCLNVCSAYKSQLSKVVGAKEFAELFALENPPQDEEALTLLRPLITLLQADGSSRPAKLDSGIVVVHSENDKFADRKTYGYEMTSASQSPETSIEDSSGQQVSKSETAPVEGSLAQEDALKTLEDTLDSNYDDGTLGAKKSEELDPQENVTHRVQSDLQPIYDMTNNIRSNMSERELEEIFLEMEKRLRTIRESYRDSPRLQNFIYEITRAAELHYYNTLLENASAQFLHSVGNDYVARQFARAFVEINASAYSRCSCDYPHPLEKPVEPKFLTFGESLIRRYADDLPDECINICDKVPYMWREYLAVCVKRCTLDGLLRQCLQTRDDVVLSFVLPALDENQWGCVVACLSELENGTCLFCAIPLAKKPDYGVLIDWSGVAREIMKREGPDEATAFLIKLESMVPNIDFDRRYI